MQLRSKRKIHIISLPFTAVDLRLLLDRSRHQTGRYQRQATRESSTPPRTLRVGFYLPTRFRDDKTTRPRDSCPPKRTFHFAGLFARTKPQKAPRHSSHFAGRHHALSSKYASSLASRVLFLIPITLAGNGALSYFTLQ